MRLFTALFTLVMAILPFLAACTSCSRQEKSPEQIRQETAEATAKLKRDTVAVAKGIKEGLSNKQVVNINTASKDELKSLTGIDDATAERIVAARPFDNKDQLVTRRVVTQEEYDKIAGRITVAK
jgi:DNA uptake protein ComE-like DNA-binding protein